MENELELIIKNVKKRNYIIYIVCTILVISLVVLAAIKIYNNATKPIDQRAYDAAITMVEKDILPSIKPYYEEYDPKYIKWISLDLLQIEVNARFVQNGIWKDIKYIVYVDISDGQCLPGIPERVLEE